MEEPRYEIRDGDFWHVWERREICIGPQLSFYVDFNMGETILLKYGSTEKILKYQESMTRKMLASRGLLDPTLTKVITFGTEVGIEEVNKVIQITGYITRFMEKYNL